MRRGPAAGLVVLAVLMAACGDGDGDAGERRPPPPAGWPSPSSTSTSTSTSTTVASSTTTIRRPAPSTTATTAGRPPAGTAVQATAPGRYTYATTGSFASLVGGVQRRDGDTSLVVDAVQGGSQHSLRQGPGRSLEQTLELRPDGTYASMVRIIDSGFAQEIRPVPPVLAVPSPAAAGRTWSWRATTVDGRTTVDSAFRVVRTETVPVGEESVPALVVEATIATRGDIVSDGTQSFWYDERARLVVRLQERTTGRLGAISFTSESTDVLRSRQPV